MSNATNIEALKAAWDALGRGDWEALTAAYSDDMIFVIPGQNDILRGKAAFRMALENFGQALPPGFEVTDLRYFAGEADGEVVNIVEWTAAKIPGGPSPRCCGNSTMPAWSPKNAGMSTRSSGRRRSEA